MTRPKRTAVGTAAGVVLPKAMLKRVNVGEGDLLYAMETLDAALA